MNKIEFLLRQFIKEEVCRQLQEANEAEDNDEKKKVGKTDTKDLEGFLDITKLADELKVPADKLRVSLKDASKGQRKVPNDKVFSDSFLKMLGKTPQEKNKIMNVIKKVQFSTEKETETEKSTPKVDVKL